VCQRWFERLETGRRDAIDGGERALLDAALAQVTAWQDAVLADRGAGSEERGAGC
jgi:hypothetical protein